ncbi:substrate-binding domain-containing protein [Escherichia coli]
MSFGRSLKVHCASGGARWKTPLSLLSIESIKRCVAANIGVSYLPRFAVEKELESGELIELPFGEQSQTITAMCAHHAGKAVSPAMHTFIQCVEESFVAG